MLSQIVPYENTTKKTGMENTVLDDDDDLCVLDYSALLL